MNSYNEVAAHNNFDDLFALRSFARRLIASWDRDSTRAFKMKSEHSGAGGPMIWSLTNHTVELGRTVLELSAQDRILIAMPLIRLMMDNAMTCEWLLLDGTAAGALVHEGMRQRKEAVSSVVAMGAAGFDAEKLGAVADELEGLAHFKTGLGRSIEQRMKAMHEGDSVYTSYRIASSLSHAGMTLAEQYLRESPATQDNPRGLSFDPSKKLESHEAWLGTSISMLILAIKCTNEISSDGRFRAQIDRATKRMGVTMDLRLAEVSPIATQKTDR